MANINVTVQDGVPLSVDVGENTLAAANSATAAASSASAAASSAAAAASSASAAAEVVADVIAAGTAQVSAVSSAGTAQVAAVNSAAETVIALAGSNAIEAANYRAGLLASASGQPFFVIRDQQVRRWINAAGVNRNSPDLVFPASPVIAPLPELRPGATWNGTAGSGFTSVPADPARTSAKPAVRLIVPPFQRFTDTLLVGVIAGANNGGSLASNLGIDRVQFDYEGRQVDVSTPTFRTFNDVNGRPVTYFAWWVMLKHPNPGAGGNARTANLYARAFAQDPTMQSRLIGPFQFNPVQTIYDKEIEIAASPAEIPGQRYKTLAGAHAWMRDNSSSFTNPLITFTEAGNYALAPANFGDPGAANGWITVRATVPIVFNSGDPNNSGLMWVRTNNWRFMGQNITIDFQTTRTMTRQGAPPFNLRDYWFDGINFTVSGGRYSLVNGGELQGGVQGSPWLTECRFTNGPVVPVAQLSRGCVHENTWRVTFNNAACVVGNVVRNLSNLEYTAAINALSVVYTGPEANWTFAINGQNDTNGRVVTLQAGSTVNTFTISRTAPSGGAYWVADVAAWINTLSGYSATVLDNTRRASCLTRPGAPSFGAFSVTSPRTTSVVAITAIDVHSDFYLLRPGLPTENLIVYGNLVYELRDSAAFLFQMSTTPAMDVVVLNNACDGDPAYPLSTQFQGAYSHLVFDHNALARQNIILAVSQSLSLDSYCQIANNAVVGIQWSGTPFTFNLTDNVLDAASTIPANSTGTVLAGTVASKFVNAPAGDFTPRGELVASANQRTARVAFDRIGDRRAALAPAGAVA